MEPDFAVQEDGLSAEVLACGTGVHSEGKWLTHLSVVRVLLHNVTVTPDSLPHAEIRRYNTCVSRSRWTETPGTDLLSRNYCMHCDLSRRQFVQKYLNHTQP